MKSLSGNKKKQTEFDYEKFEATALTTLREGHDLIGEEGVLIELIQRIVSVALEGELSYHLGTLKEKRNKSVGNNHFNQTINSFIQKL